MFQYTDADYQPGTLIHHHPEHLYRKSPGLSATEVKVFANQSPAHYRHRFLGEPVARSESAAMVLGSMVHCLVLEPQHFDSRYRAQPEPDTGTLVTVPQLRQWLKDHNLNQAGNKQELIERIVQHDPEAPVWAVMEEQRKQARYRTVKPEVMAQARAMADSVFNNSQAHQLMSRGDAEVSVWGQHESTELLIKCRPDWLRDGLCVDVKTCACASPHAFRRDLVKFGYDLQQVHYLNTLCSAGKPVDIFAFIAVESEPPYLSQVYQLDGAADGHATRRWHRIMTRFKECLETNHWPGYTDDVKLALPNWYYQQYAAEIDHGTA